MFDRFTPSARRVIVFALEAARDSGQDHIDRAAIVIGLMDVASAREAPSPDEHSGPDLAFSDDIKRCLQSALRHALRMGHNYIAPEHIHLGLLMPDDAERRIRDAERWRQFVLDRVSIGGWPDPNR